MTVRVVLRLTCNVRRARGCHGAYQLVLGAWVLPGAEARFRLDAATAGWTRERRSGREGAGRLPRLLRRRPPAGARRGAAPTP